jgi:hypothetical protein
MVKCWDVRSGLDILARSLIFYHYLYGADLAIGSFVKE